MATGRIGVTPVLRTRWSDQPTAGTTSLSGLDDNSVALVYDAGYEAVYRNGVLLSRGNDYTATDGTSITLIDATLAGDIIEVFANDLVPLTDAISKGQYNAKGALLSASAASTPGVLAVGSNDQVLTADSTTSTGLKWATPAAGGMTVIATGTLSGAAVTLSSIPGTYNNLQLDWYGATWATGNAQMNLRFNGLTAANYQYATNGFMGSTSQARGASGATEWFLSENTNDTNNTNAKNHFSVTVFNYASTTKMPLLSCNFSFFDAGSQMASFHGTLGYNDSAAAITSLTILLDTGYSFNGGTYVLYGVK